MADMDEHTMKQIEVIPVGSKVKIIEGPQATVTCVSIRSGGISYECGYWNGGTFESKYFEDFLVVHDGKTKQRIGFLQASSL